MIRYNQILDLSKEIVQYFRPLRIILFGSYGYGSPTKDSDVDLLVVLPSVKHGPRKSWEILEKTNPRFPVDILVRTPRQIKKRLELKDWFIRDIINKGKVLYDADHERVDG